jgi:hypothetical protein
MAGDAMRVIRSVVRIAERQGHQERAAGGANAYSLPLVRRRR